MNTRINSVTLITSLIISPTNSYHQLFTVDKAFKVWAGLLGNNLHSKQMDLINLKIPEIVVIKTQWFLWKFQPQCNVYIKLDVTVRNRFDHKKMNQMTHNFAQPQV